MSVSSYLDELSRGLIIRDEEKESIKRSIAYLKLNLKTWFGQNIEDHFLFGSYTRGTILPRKADEGSDIDFMVVFKNADGLKPQTFLDRLRKFVENYYPNSIIRQSHPTIVLELSHIKFELVPAYQDITNKLFGGYLIPSRSSGYTEWLRTNPAEFDKAVNTKNQENYSKIKPVIRLIKYWNTNVKVLSSYELENKIINQYYFFCTNTKDYFYKAFETIDHQWNDSQTKKNKIDKAITTLKTIKEYEAKGYSKEAEELLKTLLPPTNILRR